MKYNLGSPTSHHKVITKAENPKPKPEFKKKITKIHLNFSGFCEGTKYLNIKLFSQIDS